MLKSHHRYAYLPITQRPHYSWPGGKGLACYIAVNLEHYSFGEGLNEALVPGGHPPDVLNYSWRDYGNRVAIWRIKAMLEELGIPVTLLVNSVCYEHAPGLIESFRGDMHEISAHGRTNSEAQGLLPEMEEARLIEEVTETIRKHEGRPPAGWLGPWLSESMVTPDLLKEAGYRYVLDWCMDDQPVALATRAGPLLAIPYPQELNDSSTIVGRFVSAETFSGMIIDQFDEMLEQAREQPLIFAVALHPYIIGQPFRLRQFRRAMQHVAAHREKIWLTTAGAIATHVDAISANPESMPPAA